ncbi:MAG: DUF1449 domain-containing protein [Chromatiales bacterium]|nr:DUF1449 domain-containing protein [Chromatiales bacterium]
MIALLFSEELGVFYQNITSFPTILFTIVLVLCALFWLIACFGVLDIDFLDLNAGELSDVSPNALSMLLVHTGLTGVPVPVILTLVSLVGWVISYVLVYFLYPLIGDSLLQYLVGLPILGAALYSGVITTEVVIRPLRKVFRPANQVSVLDVIGQTAIVRTSVVTSTFGEAFLHDGGAGLILKVRATSNAKHTKGDRIVLLEYNESTNHYRVVAEEDFLGN